MTATNLSPREIAEIVATSPTSTSEPSTPNRYEEDNKRKQSRLTRKETKETRKINDNGTFIIEKTQDSLLANNNIYAQQMRLIRAKGKQYIIDNFHALAEYEHPLAERHTEMNVVADGESNATPVVKIGKYNQAA
jgi:hypothetical protein